MNNKSLWSVTGLEFHYRFDDNRSAMDAFVLNSCEAQLLAIIKKISDDLDVDICLECIPLENGSLKSILKAIGHMVVVPLIVNISSDLLMSKPSAPTEEIVRNVIDKMISDTSFCRDLKEKAELEKEIKELEERRDSIAQSIAEREILLRRSVFFDNLRSYKRFQSVSISTIDDRETVVSERTLYLDELEDFIVDYPPIVDERATISIISPVLRLYVTNNKWRGLYNGEEISFFMKSKRFRDLVEQGVVSFNSNTLIECKLERKRKKDKNGSIKFSSDSVLNVYRLIQNGNIRTIEEY